MKISLDEAAKISAYLRNQPKWQSTGTRYTENTLQHYLWQARNQATSWHDFCTVWGNGSMIETDREHLIMPGELFLCDAVLGQLWIVRLTNSGKLTKLACVSEYMNRDYGNCFNGYALLPTPERISKLASQPGFNALSVVNMSLERTTHERMFELMDQKYDVIYMRSEQWIKLMGKSLVPAGKAIYYRGVEVRFRSE